MLNPTHLDDGTARDTTALDSHLPTVPGRAPIAALQQIWQMPSRHPLPPRHPDDAPLLQQEAVDWVRSHWPVLAVAIERVVQDAES